MRYFKPGEKIRVIRVRRWLTHKLGDTATVKKGTYGSPSDPVIDIRWDDGQETTVFADQFESIFIEPAAHPLEDTRDYLNVITGETNA